MNAPGVLSVATWVALVFYVFVERTSFPEALRATMGIALMLAILAQSGGFFIALAPKFAQLGRIVTTLGAVVLSADCLVLAYGVARSLTRERRSSRPGARFAAAARRDETLASR